MIDSPKKLLIVEDSALIQERLLRLLDGIPEIKVLGVSATATDALDRIRGERPDLLLLDIALEEGDGFQVLRDLNGHHPASRVVMLTNYANPLFRQRAANWGVRHFFDKSTEFERAIDCLRQLALEGAA